VDGYRRFRGTCPLHMQLLPWRWRQKASLKHWCHMWCHTEQIG
jgi:hypothetical protein